MGDGDGRREGAVHASGPVPSITSFAIHLHQDLQAGLGAKWCSA